METKVVISTDFFKSYIKLPKNIQIKVMNFFEKFKDNPQANGIRWEKIGTEKGKELHSVRIDDDYRGIVFLDDKTNIYHILWVEPHNKSYDKAGRLPKINIANNNISIISRNFYIKNGIMIQKEKRLFDNVSAKEIMSLGVPLKYLSIIRDLPDINAFQAIKGLLEEEVYAKLEFVAYGLYVEEVKEHEVLTKENLLDYIKQEVINKALECEDLNTDIKASVQNTREILDSKNTAKEIMDFFNNALMSKRGKEVVAEFRKHNLTAFEDIIEDVKKMSIM